MKTFGLVLAMMMVIGGAACAIEYAQFDTYTDWNMISLPLVPTDPTVDAVFSDVDGGTAFDMWFTASMKRYDATTQAYIDYDPFADPMPGPFGNMLLGDGYWFSNPDAGVVRYEGVDNGVPDLMGLKTDMWISLPGNQVDGQDLGGFHLIGCPFNEAISSDPNFNLNGEGILFTDGSSVKIWSEAADVAGWVDSGMSFWDPVTDAYVDMGYFFNTDDSLRPGKAYWIQTKKDNLAMIVPALNP